jgi:hypothetical protein
LLRYAGLLSAQRTDLETVAVVADLERNPELAAVARFWFITGITMPTNLTRLSSSAACSLACLPSLTKLRVVADYKAARMLMMLSVIVPFNSVAESAQEPNRQAWKKECDLVRSQSHARPLTILRRHLDRVQGPTRHQVETGP